MDFLPAAFEAFRSYSQFIIYRLENNPDTPGKFDKKPIDYRTGAVANPHDPAIWMLPDIAIKQANYYGSGYGVGFVFTANDPFWFLDIDNCVEPCGTKWSPLALSLLSAFPGAAVEVSSSGRGLHVFGSGSVPIHRCKSRVAPGLELYTESRFVALTGTNAQGDAATLHPAAIEWLVQSYFDKTDAGNPLTDPDWWSSEPVPEWRGTTNDDELIKRMLQSRGARSQFGDGLTFRDLWDANEDTLAKVYPPNDIDIYNRSSADAALAQRLAFWTGNHAERIERLMWRSALVREKWDRDDYLAHTIRGVCARQTDWLCDKPPQSIADAGGGQSEKPRQKPVTGATFLAIEQQIELFDGCCYVSDEHKILIPGGYLLDPSQFRTTYGGFSFPMDNRNERVVRNAFEAFTESQALRAPKVDTTCFRPDIPAGHTFHQDGQRFVNTYWPIQTPRATGDVSRFHRHVDLLFPIPEDQEIVICYLAALLQHIGVKFQWCPFIQGVQGNGKTYFSRIMAYAVGQRYSHFPIAEKISAQFNDWLYERIFIGVEDIYVHDSKIEVMEALKPMITGEWQEIEGKNKNKRTRNICANFIINTNHKDGLRKTEDDRRFAPFYTPQQHKADLTRDGLTEEYFVDLYNWSSKLFGYAMIADYLENYDIPDRLNPAIGCKRAPATSSTVAAIEEGRGGIEQEIIEAIEQGIPGFKGDWASSMALDKLLVKLNAARRIPPNKRRLMMQGLGYDYHPALKDGRATANVLPDGGKPRLYIKVNSADMALQTAGQVVKAYAEAQK